MLSSSLKAGKSESPERTIHQYSKCRIAVTSRVAWPIHFESMLSGTPELMAWTP